MKYKVFYLQYQKQIVKREKQFMIIEQKNKGSVQRYNYNLICIEWIFFMSIEQKNKGSVRRYNYNLIAPGVFFQCLKHLKKESMRERKQRKCSVLQTKEVKGENKRNFWSLNCIFWIYQYKYVPISLKHIAKKYCNRINRQLVFTFCYNGH